MTLKAIERLIHLLRTNGVEHFKSLEVEVSFKSGQVAQVEIPKAPLSTAKAPPNAAAVPSKELEIPHHMNEVAAMLKLSDEELVDKMFPEGSQQDLKVPSFEGL